MLKTGLNVLNSNLNVDLKNAQTVATACRFFHNNLILKSEIRKAVTPVPLEGALLERADQVEEKEVVVDQVGSAF